MKIWLRLLLAFIAASSLVAQDIDLTGYTLAFEENFDTLSVSPNGSQSKGSAKWYHWPPYGAAGAYSVSNWATGTMKCVDGILVNSAFYHPPNGLWYSGQLASMDPTKAGFAQQYGYFSARMKMPVAGQGAWPSFWLMTVNSIPNNQGNRLEIDILEWYGNEPNIAQHVVHLWKAGGGNDTGGYMIRPAIPGGNASSQFHIYGAKVDPVNITFYIDGIQTGQSTTPSQYIGPMYVMVAYALGGGWPVTGEPFASKGDSTLMVDWVRVYSLPSPAQSPAPPKNLRIAALPANVISAPKNLRIAK